MKNDGMDVVLSHLSICRMPGYSGANQYQQFQWIDFKIEKFRKLSSDDIVLQLCSKDMEAIKALKEDLEKDRIIGIGYTPIENEFYCHIASVTGAYLGCSSKNVLPALRIDCIMEKSVPPRISALMAASLKRHNKNTEIFTSSSKTLIMAHESITEVHTNPFANTTYAEPYIFSKEHYMPFIKRVIINDPGVVVFWSDGTKTVGKCMPTDIFDPEIGLAMAISRKYYEVIGVDNPRAAFKNQLKSAENQSERTRQKKNAKMEYKKQKEIHTND